MIESKLKIDKKVSIKVSGDKSVSHRSVLFSSLAKGKSRITGFLEAEDPKNTMHSFSELGVKFQKVKEGEYLVDSPGKEGLVSPVNVLDFGNGGTGIRLSAGLISGLTGVTATLTGDESLRKRPMKRILDPLVAMGAEIFSIDKNDKAPLKIIGKKLNSFKYKSKLSSAQVKSCLMLASIASDSELEYEEEELSRDHTENMLTHLGGKLEYINGKTHFKIQPPFSFSGSEFFVPGDISSASFFIVLGVLLKKGEILIQNVGLNPARVGILEVLTEMGANIVIQNEKIECGEKTGDLLVLPSELHRIEISKSIIPSIIDEIPILTIAGLFTKGGFKISNAEDLRAKESDRIHSMVTNLRALGVIVEEYKDGYEFSEVKDLKKITVESFMDHRIAMSFLILEKLISLGIKIDDESWIDTSFPEFKKIMSEI
ncbi:MAG: 3-phosphoshikimate 1-carboxyvinyltransferase [Leptospiraceae bacterium]|nr:3-phosphoshikimate 1-carboxyvinyltransferase [Leptospiraceae bacterium]